MFDSVLLCDSPKQIPGFRFEVDFGMKLRGISFQEISGMDKELRIQEYRNSNCTIFSTSKLSGAEKYGNVTMRRGVFSNDDHFWKWMGEVEEFNDVKRRTVLIKLLDESGKITVQWQLNKAWPIRVSGTDIDVDGNAVAIDVVEIAHEQMIICNGET